MAVTNAVSRRRCEILIPGHYFCDLIFTGIPGFPALGTELYADNLTIVPGGCLNTITALRRLGVDVGWLGVVGNDPFSHVVDEWVRQEGIDHHWLNTIDAPFRRVTVSLSYVQDRAFVTHVDPPVDLLDRVIDAIEAEACAHLHFTGLTVDPRMPRLLRACHDLHITVSMDCQYRSLTLADPLVREIVGLLDIFMPNADEARRLTETASREEAAQALSGIVPLLVIKDGERGAALWQGKLHLVVPAMDVQVVDTTGAGDIFNAGFLAAYRAHADLRTCLQWGNICGGLSTKGYGGCSAAPLRGTVQAYLDEICHKTDDTSPK